MYKQNKGVTVMVHTSDKMEVLEAEPVSIDGAVSQQLQSHICLALTHGHLGQESRNRANVAYYSCSKLKILSVSYE